MDTINIVVFILYFKGSQVKISETGISVPEDCFLFMQIVQTLIEMRSSAAHYWPKCLSSFQYKN